MKRLVANNYRAMFAKPSVPLKGFIDRYGNYYELNARLVNTNRIFYSVTHQIPYEIISLYDGEDYDEAFDLYCELMIALKGVAEAESFNKTKDLLKEKVHNIIIPKPVNVQLQYGNLSLGDSELIWS